VGVGSEPVYVSLGNIEPAAVVELLGRRPRRG
jgi:hypothetical protein